MIIDRVINGMERKASKGKWTLGAAPYGYTVDPTEHTLLANEAEEKIINEIFRLYTRHRLGTRAIAHDLNDRKMYRRHGRPWSHKTVADVLVNRIYLGEIRFRQVLANDAHQAFIDPATFDLAQRILAQRGESPSRKAAGSSDYHLTGKLTCPRCGRTYLGTNAVGRSRTYRYYTCFTRSRYGVEHCAAPRIDADALDALVVTALRDFYTEQLDLAQDAVAAARAKRHQARSGLEGERASIEDQLAAKEAVVDKYLTDYEDNKIDRDAVARRVDKLAEQIRQLRQRRDELSFILDMDADEADDTYLIDLRDQVTEIISAGTVQQRKALCEALISEIHLNGTSTVTLAFQVPLSATDAVAILGPDTRTADQTTVRACPPPVRRQGLEPQTRGLRVSISTGSLVQTAHSPSIWMEVRPN
jgi:site-specific DNA recombinase